MDVTGRTGQWQVMKDPGRLVGLVPAAPMGHIGYLSDYLPPTQRWVVTPNIDTIYGSCLAHLGQGPLVVETPTDVPAGQYWTLQIVDGFTNVVHQLGSRQTTTGGKHLLVGPEWNGDLPEGFADVLPVSTNLVCVGPCFGFVTGSSACPLTRASSAAPRRGTLFCQLCGALVVRGREGEGDLGWGSRSDRADRDAHRER